MGYRDEAVEEFEGKILFKAQRSYAVEMTLGGKYFVPFSQIVSMEEPDLDGNRIFVVTEWWWKKKEPMADDPPF